MTFSLVVEDIPSKYRFCCCLHVRTGTLLFAVWQIVVHFVLITVLTAALGKSSKFREEIEYAALSMSVMSFIQWEKFASASIALPPPTGEVHNTSIYSSDVDGVRKLSKQYRSTLFRASKFFINAGEEYVAIVITLFSLMFSIMMLVGVINTKPFHLLPYCCLQFIDLFITSLSVIGFYTYLPEANELLKSKLWISALLVVLGFLLICLKGYFLLMVWLCYKFLSRSSSGLEYSQGFSIATNSWGGIRSVIGLLTCHRLISERSMGSYHHSRNAEFNGIVGDVEQSSDSHLIVMLRSQQFGISNSPTRPITVNHPCLPPKYEDVLASPVGAFDPPPYWSLECSQLSNSTPTTAANPTTDTTFLTTATTNASTPVMVETNPVSSSSDSPAGGNNRIGSVQTEPPACISRNRKTSNTRRTFSST